jgi:hypothetical protein
MPNDPVAGFYANVTVIDVQLAASYYPILVDLAKHKHCITYRELVDRAKQENPDKEVVRRAIATSTGRRLDVVRLFTTERNLPDLTSLVINKNSGECGRGFTEHFDPGLAREAVFAFDWSAVSTQFDWFVKEASIAVKPKKKISEAQALDAMSEYYRSTRARWPASIRKQRELIVELMMQGWDAEKAFERAAEEL